MENTNKTIVDIGKHRRDTVIEILKKLQDNDRVCCVRYTGYGKTYYIIKQLIDMFPNKQFLIFVPAKSLIKRYKKLFQSNNVVIKTYQSLLFMKDEEIEDNFSNVDYIICDEAHRLGKNKWRQSIKNAFDIIDTGNTKIIGLTATPKRGDKIDIVEDFFNGVETSRFDLLDGIQAGYIPKIDYVVAYCDLSGLNKEIYDERMEDVDRYEIDKLLNVSNIIKENITEDKLKENLKVVLYVSRLKDINTAKESCYKWFTEAFPNKNIKVFSLSSEYTDRENSDYLDDYSDDEDNNSIDIMVSCNKLNEGLHLPKCSIAILLRRTTSPIVYFQQIGRAINGSKPVVFDLVNNSTHIKQIENDFRQGNQENLDLSIQSNKSKKIFSECVNLISRTEEIEEILNRYKYKYDQELKNNVIDDYNNGYKLIDIANRYNISLSAVSLFLRGKHNRVKNRGNKTKIKTKHILENNKESILKEVKKSTYRSVAFKYSVPEEALRKWCNKNGVKSSRTNKKDWDCSSEVRYKVNRYIKEGLSLKDISNKLNLSYKNVVYLREGTSQKEKSKRNMEFLKQNYSKYTFKELCTKIGVSGETLKKYAGKLNISTCDFKGNEKPELDYIANNCNNMTIKELVEQTGRSESAIRQYIKRHNLKYKTERKRSKSRTTVIDNNVVCSVMQMYEDKIPITNIAKKLDISIYGVKKILVENGYKMYMPTVTQDNIDKIIDLYKNNKNVKEIAICVGMCQNNVNLILMQEGLK